MPEPSLQEGKSQQRSSTLDTVLKISSLLLATTWIFFLVGWFYLHVFYGCFGIDVNTLDLPIYYPVIASQFAFDEFITLLCCIFALGYLTGNIWVFEDKIRRWLSCVFPPFPFQLSSPHKERAEQVHRWIWRIFAWVILPPFVLTELVMMSIQLGQQEGKDWRQHPSNKTTNVCLNFKKEEEQLFNPELVKANASGMLMLLVQTKELVLVFLKDEHGRAKRGVFVVPRTNLLSVYNAPCVNRPSVIVSPPATPERTPKPKRRLT